MRVPVTAGSLQSLDVVGVGNGRTGAVGMWAVGIGRRVVPRRARADAGVVADGDRGCVVAPPSVVTHAAGNGGSQAPRQRVGGECLRRLMSMLSCAKDSSAAASAALAAATERPSAVSAAIAEWGMVPQTPTATTMSGSKVHVCGSRALGTRRATEAHGLRRSHGSYLACFVQQRYRGWCRQRR